MTVGPPDDDRTEALAEAVRAALAAGEPLEIRGGGTKRFYGEPAAGEPLAVGGHRGVLSYEPSELVLTARAGTPLAEIERLLSEHGQMLACEPPHFGPGATLGGTVACGLSGPRRPWAGAVRDFVLGVRLIDGRAETGRYGGEVMKNVAGYDVSRLVTGALGTLGLLLDVSLKVLPAPERETTRVLELAADRAVELFNALAGRPVPLTAAAWESGLARVRLGGSAAGVAAALAEVGGEDVPPAEAAAWWSDLREQRLAFFAGDAALWRLAVRPARPPLDLPGDWLLDWGGGQRWLRTAAPAETIRAAASGAGGHATAFRGAGPGVAVFHPLPDALMALHRRVKAALDPAGLFNPGRQYAGL
jgi:glycolate oxidase FAD binding subunit